ncbi:MAG TPA: HEAT repeat domain-containing protein [Labilithrix sp.]|nr:HEAT repeat domain-containing protein [Labilithrix sp.]
MRLAPFFSGAVLSLMLLGVSTPASAAGAGLDAKQLPEKTRAELRAEIDKARAETPELFKTVENIAARAKELDASARAPGIPLTMHFKPLGQRAFYPLLDTLVFDAHAKDLPPSAAAALRLGLIEAVGAIRDARAIPVLAKILEVAGDDQTARAAAEGLARIGTDSALDILTSAATKAKTPERGNDRERAILAGMHDARRERAARFLAKRLQEKPDDETARVLAKSLGGVGNAWAWKTLSNQTEASATRSIAAAALLDAYVRATADVREQAAKALLVVDDPNTPSLIAQAKKGASADVTALLDELDRRFAANPAR